MGEPPTPHPGTQVDTVQTGGAFAVPPANDSGASVPIHERIGGEADASSGVRGLQGRRIHGEIPARKSLQSHGAVT